MTRITNSTQILALLQAHLERTRKTRAGKATPSGATSSARPLARLQSIAQSGALTDEDIEQVLVAGLLEEEFGADIANEPKFQGIIADVLQTLRADQHARKVLSDALQLIAARNDD